MMSRLQRGFSVISAIFLLVVLSFLGVAMVTFSTNQHQSEAMDVLGSRAYQAARAGVEWAAYYVVQSPASAPAAWAGCAPATPITLAGDLAQFTVTVNCSAVPHVEGVSTVWIYDVSSTATLGGPVGSPGYIERQLNVRLGK